MHLRQLVPDLHRRRLVRLARVRVLSVTGGVTTSVWSHGNTDTERLTMKLPLLLLPSSGSLTQGCDIRAMW
eukprot:8771446-Pyramimonas_sp.AAC.1